jgi:5-methylcytosine-specific restriction endonuclease McrA
LACAAVPAAANAKKEGSMRRFANRVQRLALMILQDGKCAICGCVLEAFDADHIQPFSKKGRTELWNLQALCVTCHLEKSRGQASKKCLMNCRTTKTC